MLNPNTLEAILKAGIGSEIKGMALRQVPPLWKRGRQATPTDEGEAYRQAQPPADIAALAAELATGYGVEPAEALCLLDDGDIASIEAGDTAMLGAWETAVRLLARPKPTTVPEAPPGHVICWTPKRASLVIEAQDAARAAWLAAMNPAPSVDANPASVGGTCRECRHWTPDAINPVEGLGHCAAGSSKLPYPQNSCSQWRAR
jgi:hypothetical protein